MWAQEYAFKAPGIIQESVEARNETGPYKNI